MWDSTFGCQGRLFWGNNEEAIWIYGERFVSAGKELPVMQETQETWVWFLGQEDPLEKEMATHSSILAWKISWTEEPGGLQSKELQRGGQDWAWTRRTMQQSINYGLSLVAQMVKNMSAMQEIRVQFLGQKDPLEEEMAIHSQYSCPENSMDRESWRATQSQSMGWQRIGQDWMTNT